MATPNLKTWVEIDKNSALHNVKIFRSIIKKKTNLYAVVKSNAYGHGLREFSLTINGKVDGFCVDSVYEGKTLRSVGIKKSVLVLGPTISKKEMKLAEENNLEITVSTFEALKQLLHIKNSPYFHLKIDTGMHRQGFFVDDVQKVIKIIKSNKLNEKFKGVYTHFASAKNIAHQDYTNKQIEEFKKVQTMFKESGLEKIMFHASGTGGTILYPQANFDMVRIGAGLYGYWPSKESKIQHLTTLNKKLILKPVLSWKTKISEIKKLKKNDYVGYDLAEKIRKNTLVSIIPIGYWHGFSRTLSHKGLVLVNGECCKVIGKVSMDLIIIECKNSKTKVGDVVTIIGKDGKEILTADNHVDTSDNMIYKYEVLTAINPLIKRVVTNKK